jgi:hypothetical protein
MFALQIWPQDSYAAGNSCTGVTENGDGNAYGTTGDDAITCSGTQTGIVYTGPLSGVASGAGGDTVIVDSGATVERISF